MVEGVPVQKVVKLRNQGADNNKIIEALRKEEYSFQQIRDAIQQADIKNNVNGGASSKQSMGSPAPAPKPPKSAPAPAPTPPTSPKPSSKPAPAPTPPTPSQSQERSVSNPAPAPAPRPPQTSVNLDEIQRVMEEIIDEKWEESEDVINNLIEWKGKVNTKIKEFDVRLSEVNDRINALNTVLGKKAEAFNETMQSVDTEIKALERSLNKLVPTLSDNISELKDLVNKSDKKK